MWSDFCDPRLLGLRWRNFFQRDHAIQHSIALRHRAFRIFQRRKTIWTSDQTCKDRGFREIQLRCAFAKVSLLGCFDSITAGAEIDSVDVKLENLLLGELMLNPKCHHRFEYFSAQRTAPEWKAISGKLLGDAAGAFLGGATHNIADQRAQNPAPINPFVLVGPRVLARQHRIDENRRDFAEGNLKTIRASQAAVNFSIDIVNGVSLRHFADILHVEGLRPRPIKEEDGEAGDRQQNKQSDFTAVTEKAAPATFPGAEAGEEFHR